MKKKLSYWIVLLSLSGVSHAVDLIDIYQQSLENDPVFKQAYNTYLANAEAIPQAQAALYPQVTLKGLAGHNTLSVLGDFSGTGVLTDVSQPYDSTQFQLYASQAIFNYHAWSLIKQAKASVKAAQAMFNDSAQDLILRTSAAYFAILLAEDTLHFAESKKRANKRQLEQARQRFQVGLDPITSVYEARAASDQSTAEVISARNDKINKSESLRRLTNHVYDVISPLRNGRIPLVKPEPQNADEWIATSLKQNYKFYAAKYKLDSSRENLKVQVSDNWPVLSLSSNLSTTSNSVNDTTGSNTSQTTSSFFIPNRKVTGYVALSVNFPVYQGGLVQSKTRQAQYDYASSSEELERIYRDVAVNSRIAYNTIMDGLSKVRADRQTVLSQKVSLESIEAQFQVGTRTMVDVLDAQRKLFEVQRELSKDQYGLIHAILNLKYLAGTLNVQDLEEINSWLNTTRINQFKPTK